MRLRVILFLMKIMVCMMTVLCVALSVWPGTVLALDVKVLNSLNH